MLLPGSGRTGWDSDGVRVLGVDPGLTRCGLGVVDGRPGRRVALVEVGVARSTAGDPVPTRLLAISTEIERWLTRHEPDVVAVEQVFAQHNVRTVMGTAQAAGAAMLAAARHGIPVALHTPSAVKAAVTGSGRAEKAQVQSMVSRILHLTGPPRPADAADALALAICELWRPAVGAAAGVPTTAAARRWAEADRLARRGVRF